MALTKRQVFNYALILTTATLNLAPMSYDGNMINNVNILPAYSEYFKLDASLLGLNVAIVSAGCFMIGPFAGLIVDKWGRKVGMFVGSSIAIVSVVLQSAAPNEVVFVIGRFILGLSIVLSIAAATSIVTEQAHPKHRGTIVGLLMSVVFILNIFVNVAGLYTYLLGSDWAWRGLVLGEGIEPFLSLFLIPFVDESPRWLVSAGRSQDALEVLAKLHSSGDQEDLLVLQEFREICDTVEFEKNHEESWMSLVRPAPNFRRFLLAILCAVFSQVTGAYTISYFQTIIITNAGITSIRSALLLSLGTSIFVWVAMIVGSMIVDRIGRRPLFLYGTGSMTVCLAFMAGLGYASEATQKKSYGIGTVFFLFLFMGSMSVSWMVLSFVYPPEILKYTQRAKGMAASQSIGYAFSCMNQYVIPLAITNINWKYYAIVAGYNVLIIAVIWWLFKETKGRSLEQMDLAFDPVVHSVEANKTEILEAVRVTTVEEGREPAKKPDSSLSRLEN